MTRTWKSPCGMMELRCGRWQDVLADVVECDAVLTDPPYSEWTHKGNETLDDQYGRTTLNGYSFLTAVDVRALVDGWVPRLAGWFLAMTDDFLSWEYRSALAYAGFYSFASVSLIQHRPRLGGDGPGSCTVHIQVARPKQKRFCSWGSLPGWYKYPPAKIKGVNGAKPLGLMQQIVGHYSRPNDLIVDPYAGSGTTLLAAAIEGRRAIGAEMDPKTFDLAVKRLSKGYTPNMFVQNKPKAKQEPLL